mmetsp:Transcript_87672/g.203963  ORF Transcript_87672/g.203963 Transcript_87672/m.203963 type:complete len:172 (-) Transcript_87672:91-606(-)
MSSKRCDKCGHAYTGFGATCSSCRKTKTHGTTAGVPSSGTGNDKCTACGKTAYLMERIQVEGEIFHPTCFRCKHCNNKLSTGAFSKSDEGNYYCKVHYEQLFKLRGRYNIDGGSTALSQMEMERATALNGAAGVQAESLRRRTPKSPTSSGAIGEQPGSTGEVLTSVACTA